MDLYCASLPPPLWKQLRPLLIWRSIILNSVIWLLQQNITTSKNVYTMCLSWNRFNFLLQLHCCLFDGIGDLVTFDLEMLTVDCFTKFKSEFNLNLDSTLRMEAGKVRFGWVFWQWHKISQIVGERLWKEGRRWQISESFSWYFKIRAQNHCSLGVMLMPFIFWWWY